VADLGRADHRWAGRDSLDPCRAAHKQPDAPARTLLIVHVLGSKCGWSTVELWILRATLLYQSVLPADQGLLATAAGLALLPETGVIWLADGLSGRVTAHTGPRFPMIVGSLIGAAGFLSMCLTDATTPRDQPRWNGKLQDDGMRA
jgi:hypothetical protein